MPGQLEDFRVELQDGQEVIHHGSLRLPDGREIVVKSVLGVKRTTDGKTIMWGRGREIKYK